MLHLFSSCLIAISIISSSYFAQSAVPVTITDQVPILMYHEIGTPEGPWKSLYVSENNFRAQIEYLHQNNFNTITMEQLEKNRAGLLNLPEKPIVLSFDDGYASMYDFVYPLLSEYGMTATFYIFPEKFGTYNSLTPDQIKKMSDNHMEFGSHSMSHPDLTRVSEARLHYEIFESKRIIEEITGHPVTSFCYPAGRYDQKVISVLIDAGYLSAVTTKYGKAMTDQHDFELHRIRINYEDSLSAFSRKIE